MVYWFFLLRLIDLHVYHGHSKADMFTYGAIQVLRNAMGMGVYASAQISVKKVHGPTSLALQGDGLVSNLKKKGNVY